MSINHFQNSYRIMRVQEKCKGFTKKYIVDRQNPFINTGILFSKILEKRNKKILGNNFKHTLKEVSQ